MKALVTGCAGNYIFHEAVKAGVRPKNKMKVGVIGTGTMGKNHVRIYSELKEVYAFDADKEKLKRLSEYDAIVCDSMDDLLERVDAVSICVPTQYHLEVAQSGKKLRESIRVNKEKIVYKCECGKEVETMSNETSVLYRL